MFKQNSAADMRINTSGRVFCKPLSGVQLVDALRENGSRKKKKKKSGEARRVKAREQAKPLSPFFLFAVFSHCALTK